MLGLHVWGMWAMDAAAVTRESLVSIHVSVLKNEVAEDNKIYLSDSIRKSHCLKNLDSDKTIKSERHFSKDNQN